MTRSDVESRSVPRTGQSTEALNLSLDAKGGQTEVLQGASGGECQVSACGSRDHREVGARARSPCLLTPVKTVLTRLRG